MIAPQELRIGNFVEVENYKIIQLENIHPKGTTKGDEIYLSSMLKPIELTEDWLLKLSFEKVNYTYWSKGLAVHNHDIVSFYMLYEQNRTYIKYVHQLQNLYFALTGEELTIKEQP